jgi:hypothetical protein
MTCKLYWAAAVLHQHRGLIGAISNTACMLLLICLVPYEEGGMKVAVHWLMEGHHLGCGLSAELGEPTGIRHD